ncbi:NAD(P)-binding protein [Roridomyces roridus]|uniref:NAD(P)-binding protein n=1 Tax=Roridomyces roridus TaxID=1738132 RepID=A0AAD7FP58_9AGAR|nr:NAD(P)-binding protein [Roridomyces roridus]
MSQRVAVVTGAAQGIGKTIALRLADDGFDVAINDIPFNAEKAEGTSAEIRAKGRASSVHIADVSNEEQVQQMIETVVAAHGGIDVFVANAGIAIWKPLLETSAKEFDKVMNVNARGTFLCYKYAGAQMVAQGRGGRIIGACSYASKTGAPNFSAYCASKFAVRGLTQAAAHEFGPHQITVNAYAPGFVEGELLRNTATLTAQVTGQSADAWVENHKNNAPMQRLGTQADIAHFVSYIVSKQADYITGQSVCVNGGIFFD